MRPKMNDDNTNLDRREGPQRHNNEQNYLARDAASLAYMLTALIVNFSFVNNSSLTNFESWVILQRYQS